MRKEPLLKLPVATGLEHICILQLNRPESANAYNAELLEGLLTTLKEIKSQPELRALMICSAGERSFCAGADRYELRERRLNDGIELLSRSVFDELAAIPIPTVACINGAAIGGGLELALACDIRVCSQNALFALPELSLCLTPAAGGMRRLPAIVGLGRAKEMILFQRRIDAIQAFRWGLVTYQGADFHSHAMTLAEQVALLDPMALRLAKTMLNATTHPMQLEFEAFAQAVLYEQQFQRTYL